jgi:lipid A 4'-phosphatase
MMFFALASLAAVAASFRTFLARGSLIGLAQARCWFLVAALAAGPGLVANVVLKDNWGRARPREIVEFGGAKQFTPPLLPAHECVKNCAFVSGEASSVFVPFFALALLVPHYRAALIAGGIAAGLIAGIIRMSQGAHFLSDIVFAGIFMALTVSVLHILMIGIWRDTGRGRGSAAILDFFRALRRSLSPVPTPPGSSPEVP